MSDAPKFDLRGANIGNLAGTVHGNQIATQHIDAQHVDASEQTFEFLLADFQQFINDLHQKHPDATDETAIQIIDVEAKTLQQTQPLRWQNFLNLKRLWNGGKKAAFKVGEHYAEQNPLAKVRSPSWKVSWKNQRGACHFFYKQLCLITVQWRTN